MTQKPVQKPLWSEHIYKALDDTICALAPENTNAYQWFGCLLWPDKAEPTAYSRCKACLDPQQESTNFSPSEFLFILEKESQADLEITHKFTCDKIGRHVGEKKAPKSPKTILLEQQAEALAYAASIQRDIDRIDAAAELKVANLGNRTT